MPLHFGISDHANALQLNMHSKFLQKWLRRSSRLIGLFASGLVAPLLLAITVMLLMQKHPGFVIWAGILLCIATMLADTLLSFVKAGKIGSLAIGGETSADVPEGKELPCCRGHL